MTDQGKQYTSHEFRKFLIRYNIKHITTTAYNPTGNSISERINQEIGKGLRALRNLTIGDAINKIEFSINNLYSSTLKCSPHAIIYSTNLLDPLKRINIINTSKLNERVINRLNKK